jgi:hypothetical protein
VATAFIQTPADMSIEFVVGDELNVALAFSTGSSSSAVATNLTGYTLEAKVFVPVFANPSGSLGQGAYTIGATAATFAITATSRPGGLVALGLTEAQTSALSPAVGYRWYFRWTDTNGYTLTVLSGSFTARSP